MNEAALQKAIAAATRGTIALHDVDDATRYAIDAAIPYDISVRIAMAMLRSARPPRIPGSEAIMKKIGTTPQLHTHTPTSLATYSATYCATYHAADAATWSAIVGAVSAYGDTTVISAATIDAVNEGIWNRKSL